MDRADDRASGDLLRRERTRRRLTLAQVAQATRVRERYLVAIENDAVDDLPGPVSAVGFIQIYARFLGFDPAPFVRTYKLQVGSLSTPAVPVEVPRDSYSPRRAPSFVIPVIFAVFLLALGGYLYQQVAMYASGSGFTPPPPRGTSLAVVVPTPVPSPPPLPSPTATSLPPSLTPASTSPRSTATSIPTRLPTVAPTETPGHGVRIDAEITGRVWLQVESDGKVVFSGILTPGEKRTWTAAKSVMLWAGNAGYVLVTYNGKPLGTMGTSGKVMKVTWNATT